MTNTLKQGNPSRFPKLKKTWDKCRPLLSKLKKPAKIAGITAGAVVLTSAVAIGGANLGTYFDYTYNTYPYHEFGNKTKFKIREIKDPLMQKALETARVPIIGNKAPDSADVDLVLSVEGGKKVLTAKYTMVWPSNKGMKKRDEEVIDIAWVYDEKYDRFDPLSAMTRYHYKWVDMPLHSMDDVVIVIQNPAHTPGVPGSYLRYMPEHFDPKAPKYATPNTVDVFTMFSAEKWAGSCLSTGLPHKFEALDVTFNATIVI